MAKHGFKVPFVCGARNLGEALRRISEGAAMIRTKGEAGTGALTAFFNTFSMKTYVLFHFERKNYVTIIVKLLYRTMSRRQEAL